MSWEPFLDAWKREDVNAMSDALLREFRNAAPERVASLLQHLLNSMRDDKRWIQQQRDLMRDEAERVSLLGKTMAAAGLRSYTDEKGRIFVAARHKGKESNG